MIENFVIDTIIIAMDWHPIQGGVEIFLVASCHGNQDKLRPDGPLGSYADFLR